MAGGRVRSPVLSMPLVLAQPTPPEPVLLTVLAGQGGGPTLPGAEAYEGLGLPAAFVIRAGFTVLPRQGTGSALQSATANEGAGNSSPEYGRWLFLVTSHNKKYCDYMI